MEISLMSVEALAEPFSASVVPYDLTLYYVPQDYSATIQLWLWKYLWRKLITWKELVWTFPQMLFKGTGKC